MILLILITHSGALAAIGNVVCQRYVEKREQLDKRRVSQFALTTMLIVVCNLQSYIIGAPSQTIFTTDQNKEFK